MRGKYKKRAALNRRQAAAAQMERDVAEVERRRKEREDFERRQGIMDGLRDEVRRMWLELWDAERDERESLSAEIRDLVHERNRLAKEHRAFLKQGDKRAKLLIREGHPEDFVDLGVALGAIEEGSVMVYNKAHAAKLSDEQLRVLARKRGVV